MVVTVWVCRTVAIKNLGCTSEWTKVEYKSIHKWCLQVYITAIWGGVTKDTKSRGGGVYVIQLCINSLRLGIAYIDVAAQN